MSWELYFVRKTKTRDYEPKEWFEYKDSSVKTLPANLPMPPTNSFYYMFVNCHQLQDISALAKWNVSNVKNIRGMFVNCHQLQDITALSNWNVSKVENMSCMFLYCKQLNISDDSSDIKSHIRSLPKRTYPKQDHTLLLNSLWERTKPLLKDTTKLNGHFKRYDNACILIEDLPSDWQGIELPRWNP